MNDKTRAQNPGVSATAENASFDRLTGWVMLLVGAALTALTASGWLVSSAAARIVLALVFSVLVASGAYVLGRPARR